MSDQSWQSWGSDGVPPEVAEDAGEAVHVETSADPGTAVLRHRTAFVTGGSRGIGASIALALASAGASVAVNFRENAAAAEELCCRIQSAAGVAIPVRADVSDPAEIAPAISAAGVHFGRPVDILVNCVGGQVVARPFLSMNWNDVQQTLDLNLKGAFHCCQAVLPAMMERNAGWIVNIGSIVTWSVPPVQWSAYAMAKLALKNMTRSLALEVAGHRIRVNMVSPGFTETGSTLELPRRMRDLQAIRTPLRRLAEPADIADTVLFLCSPASQFITGADIPVCGGASM